MNTASTLEDLMFESNFTILPAQTTVYSVTYIKHPGDDVKHLLVALTRGRILHCSYEKERGIVRRRDRSIAFRWIGADCSIISIHSLTCRKRGVVIGISYSKESCFMFNLYWYNNPLQHTVDIPAIANNCQKIDISFTPYQLTHCKIYKTSKTETLKLFVLLGGDKRAHQYAPHNGSYVEGSNHLVELSQTFDCIPTYIDFKSTVDKKRITAVGFQQGSVVVYVTDIERNEVLMTHMTQHDSPIVNITLFSTMPHISHNSKVNNKSVSFGDKHSSEVHLLVVSAWENSVVYRAVADNKFQKQVVLLRSADFDIPTCCTVADVDHNGENDIMIGTYGQELIVYKFTEASSNEISASLCRSFSYPVINVVYLDMIGDGLEELVVITSKGLHVFQYNMAETAFELNKRMKELTQDQLQDIVKKLTLE